MKLTKKQMGQLAKLRQAQAKLDGVLEVFRDPTSFPDTNVQNVEAVIFNAQRALTACNNMESDFTTPRRDFEGELQRDEEVR